MPPPSDAGARAAGLPPLLLQYLRFGAVGLAATAVHVAVYAGLIELLAAAPLAANALGFAAGVNVSFVGHRGWTFRNRRGPSARRSLARFWAVALIGFALNSGFVGLITGPFGLAYGWAIPAIAGVTPLATFALSKLWAFRG